MSDQYAYATTRDLSAGSSWGTDDTEDAAPLRAVRLQAEHTPDMEDVRKEYRELRRLAKRKPQREKS